MQEHIPIIKFGRNQAETLQIDTGIFVRDGPYRFDLLHVSHQNGLLGKAERRNSQFRRHLP